MIRLPARWATTALLLSCALVGASRAANAADAPAGGSYTARLVVDAGIVDGPRLQAELFGVAWNWTDSGGGLMEYGEMLRDRSFRNQGEVMARVWVESPNGQTRGRVRFVSSGGHDKPWGGRAYPGFMRLSQETLGYTCISQQLGDPVEAGAQYELHLSARAEGTSGAGLSVFFADQHFTPIEKLDKLAVVTANAWSDYRFVLKPEKSQSVAFLRICLASQGELGVDEVRLRRLGGELRVRDRASTRIQELGVRSLRWPTGSDADTFEWRESIGKYRERGEIPTQFGLYQMPNLGLHEFLDFCEAKGIVPLITVNIRAAPENAAELVEYVLGPQTSPMGALRAANGRTKPWDVRHFELGNEPTELYRADFDRSDTAKGYVKLASATAVAMRAKARQLDKRIELKGVVEAGFAMADWISLVPMLSKWNGVVLDRSTGLRTNADQIKGNFYSAFTWKSSERELFEEVMGGGTTLAATVRKLSKDYSAPLPFWLTEYSVMIQKKKFLGGPEIQLDRAKDFQAAMSVADMLIVAIQERFGGAYLFNLAQWGTWGVIGNPVDLRLRPAGLAFSMIAKLAGETPLPVTVEGGKMVRLTSGEGNNPAKMQYPTIAAIASRSENTVQAVVLNRSYNADEKLWISLRGFTAAKVEVHRLGPESLVANNEEKSDTVSIRRSVDVLSGFHIIDLPARSLLRVSYSK